MQAILDWFTSTSLTVVPHYAALALLVYALCNEVLPKVQSVKANSSWQLVFNQLNRLLLPVLGRWPVLGPFLALLDTPGVNERPPSAPPSTPLPPVIRAAGKADPRLIVALGLAFLAIAACVSINGGCAHNPPNPNGPTPTQQYEAAFARCMEGKGLQVVIKDANAIWQIFDGPGTMPEKLKELEALGITTGDGGINDLATCAITAWTGAHPINGQPTAGQAAVRIFQARHTHAPGVHGALLLPGCGPPTHLEFAMSADGASTFDCVSR